MSISFARYVDITSGVGAANAVATRSLDGLVITNNTLVPTNTLLTFNSADDVGTYFGTASEEYKRAAFYFGWISKNITAPRALNFWFWNNDVATASKIFGKPATYLLSSFTSITTGDITLTFGGHTFHLTGIDLSVDASLAAVAATLQTAIRAQSGGGAAWTSATVTFDATRGCFDLVSGTAVADTISVTAGVTTDIAGPLGWLTGAILSNGTAAQLIVDNLISLVGASNNFGSFCYSTALAVSLSNIEAAAAWNDSLNPNIQFMFSVAVSAANASAWSAGLIGIGGNTVTLSPLSAEYPEMVPMMLMSATDYTARNSVQNYMFNVFNLTPAVLTNADADIYDALRVNYYGQTQTAGQLVRFYQRGNMMGLPVDPVDQNVYANEVWLKDAAAASILTLLLSLPQVAANSAGRAQLLSIMQGIINLALFNGTISVGKPFSDVQKLYIANVTGDPQAWQQVQNTGYWIDAVIQSYVRNGITQWKAVYTLIYSKDDVIRLVEGRDILI